MRSDLSQGNSPKYVVWIAAIAVAIWLGSASFPDGASALLVVLTTSVIALLCFRYFTHDKEWITTVFLAGLVVRLTFGLFVDLFEQQSFFGGDAFTYHAHGGVIRDYWMGLTDAQAL